MKRIAWMTAVIGIGLAVLTAARVVAEPKQPAAKKAKIPDYLSKDRIESPTEQLLADKSVPMPAFVNPKVEPGKVRWHKTFADACAAAKKSAKPVLLFQMMGKLDERFC